MELKPASTFGRLPQRYVVLVDELADANAPSGSLEGSTANFADAFALVPEVGCESRENIA